MRKIVYLFAIACLLFLGSCQDLGGKRVLYLAHTLPTTWTG